MSNRWTRPPFAAALVVAVLPLSAQSLTVVPPGYAVAEAPSMGSLAGFHQRFRQQIVLAAPSLQAMQGRAINGVWIRRARALDKSFPGSSSVLRVALSHTNASPATPSTVFARNRGPSPVVVFQGVVAFAPTPKPPATIPWQSPFAVHIPFSRSFTYNGGNLCIELEGTPQNPPPSFSWPADFDHTAGAGVTQAFGAPCGGAATQFVETMGAWRRNIVPGGVARIFSVGRSGTPGIVLLAGLPSVPVSLASLGAPGCTLYVQPVVQISGLYPPQSGVTFTVSYSDVPIPAQPGMLGARFCAQGANFDPASNQLGVTTTNGLDVTVSGVMPPGEIATINSEVVSPGSSFPPSGRVLVSRGPVLQFVHT